MEIVKIDAEITGLKENKAKEIEAIYAPMVNMVNDIEEQFNELVEKEVTPEIAKDAREMRLNLAKIRVAGDKGRKEAKEESLRIGKAIQGAYNTLEYAIKSKEEKLLAIERHQENEEKERIESLYEERREEALKYVDNEGIIPTTLGDMEEQVWVNYIAGLKSQYETQKEAEKKAEAARIEQDRTDRLHRERKELLLPYWSLLSDDQRMLNFGVISETAFNTFLSEMQEAQKDHQKKEEEIVKENERLQKAAEAKEKQLAEERKLAAKKEEADRLKREEEKQKENERHESEMKKEREEKQRIADELKAKEEAEEKRKQDEEAAIQAELKKGDQAKIKDLKQDLSDLKSKYTFKAKKNQKTYAYVGLLIDKIIDHISE